MSGLKFRALDYESRDKAVQDINKVVNFPIVHHIITSQHAASLPLNPEKVQLVSNGYRFSDSLVVQPCNSPSDFHAEFRCSIGSSSNIYVQLKHLNGEFVFEELLCNDGVTSNTILERFIQTPIKRIVLEGTELNVNFEHCINLFYDIPFYESLKLKSFKSDESIVECDLVRVKSDYNTIKSQIDSGLRESTFLQSLGNLKIEIFGSKIKFTW